MRKVPLEVRITILLSFIGLAFALPSVIDFFSNRNIEKKPLSISSASLPGSSMYYEKVGIPDDSVFEKKYVSEINWVEYGDPSYTQFGLRIENLDTGSEVAISKKLPIKITKYKKPLSNRVTNVLAPTEPIGGGGGSVVVPFEAVLDPDNEYLWFASPVDRSVNEGETAGMSDVVTSSLTLADYYYFDPGDVELFDVTVFFTQPGEYEFQIGIDLIDEDRIKTIWFEKTYTVNILKQMNVWDIVESGPAGFTDARLGAIENVATCTFIEPTDNVQANIFSYYRCVAPLNQNHANTSNNYTEMPLCSSSDSNRVSVGGHAYYCIFDNKPMPDLAVIDGPFCNNPKYPYWSVMDSYGEVSIIPEFDELTGEYRICPFE